MNKDLTVGKPERVLWRYCIPLLGSVIFQQLYNIADSLVAGKYVGKNALAAVGNSYEITLIYMAFAFGCNMGCSVIAAQFFGAKNYRKMKTTVYTTFIYSAVLCLILTLTGLFAGGALLHLIHTAAVKQTKTHQYYTEASNVDVANEMVNLIVAQRAYEMNSKAIQASDEMMQQANALR